MNRQTMVYQDPFDGFEASDLALYLDTQRGGPRYLIRNPNMKGVVMIKCAGGSG